MVKIGATFQKARIAQGKTIADAAAETKIRRDYLHALEEERFEVIGGEAWVRGFIRAYGRWLSLDTTLLVNAYDAQHPKGHSPTAIPGANNGNLPLRERIRRSMPFVIGFSVVVIVLGVYLNKNGPGVRRTNEALAPAPVVEQPQSGNATQPQGTSQTTATGQSQPTVAGQTQETGQYGGADQSGQPAGTPMDAPELLIKATRPVNVTVIAGNPASDVVLAANEIKEVTDPERVRLHVSDAGAVRIQVNGQPLPSIGADNVAVELTCEKGMVACEARDQ